MIILILIAQWCDLVSRTTGEMIEANLVSTLLPKHAGLHATTRLRGLASAEEVAGALEWGALVVFGMLAAASMCFLDLNGLLKLLSTVSMQTIDLRLERVPGHAILRVVFPMVCGLAVVPRQRAGTVMGLVAGMTGSLISWSGLRGEELGFGSMTSLIATGPILDWTLRRTRGGVWQMWSFMLAGLSSNVLALLMRGLAKAWHWESPGRRPLAEWLTQAVGTYILCGLIAGFISGLVLFTFRRDDSDAAGASQP